jgi:predicted anti-sigma-YlaC factor YlaD
MRHQEFEKLLFDREILQRDERVRLENHLQDCDQCSLLSDSLEAVEAVLRSAPSVQAPAGFAARFQIRLEKARQRKKTRLLFLTTALSGIGILAALGLIGYGLVSSGPTIFAWILKTVNQMYWLGTVVDVILDTVILFLESLVKQLPLVTMLVVSAAVSLLSLTWVTSFYRFGYRGIRRE